jgi:Tol biopolymer transport system component
MFRGPVIAGLAALAVAVPSAAAAERGAPRILYVGDWSGHWALYAADPAGRRPSAQITFDEDVAAPVPSPDGRRIAFLATSAPCRLVVAKPDGSGRRTVDRTASRCMYPYDLSWSPDSERLLYRLGGAVSVIRADGKGKRVVGTGTSPAWSPNGRSVAFLGSQVYVSTKRKLVGVFSGGWEFAWSPTGKWIAVVDAGFTAHSSPEVVLVRPDGRGLRKVSDDYASELAWSQDGRFLAFHAPDGVEVVDVTTGGSRLVASPHGFRHAWSPKGHLLAFDGSEGLELLDAVNGTTRYLSSDHTLEPTWSPDGRSIAYVVRLDLPDYYDGDLKIADLSGTVRTVVDASGVAGGQMDLSGWIRPRGTLRYRPPAPRSAPTVSGQELVSPWKIERIAADGGRIAYVSCGHIFVWTPATGDVRQAEPAASLLPFCKEPNNNAAFEPFQIYDLALAGDRLAFGTRTGNSTQRFSLYEERLSPRPMPHVVMQAGGYAGCGVTNGGLGELAGAGDLVVFSRWREVDLQPPPGCGVRTTSQEIDRLDPGGCPCPVLGSSPGPLVPADVDEGRIAAFGDNKTMLLDPTGAPILSIPISVAAAQLARSDLVAVRRGALLHYDAHTGALIHTWALPDVPTSGSCGSPHPWTCSASLMLLDARRGFATYAVAGQVHVIRLADGHDVAVGAGTTARFFTDGLAYADGSRIRVVPFESLALR